MFFDSQQKHLTTGKLVATPGNWMTVLVRKCILTATLSEPYTVGVVAVHPCQHSEHI